MARVANFSGVGGMDDVARVMAGWRAMLPEILPESLPESLPILLPGCLPVIGCVGVVGMRAIPFRCVGVNDPLVIIERIFVFVK